MTTFNKEDMLKTLIETAENTDVTLAVEMQKVADEFGESALMPTKKGGLNRNAFRKGAKLETKQKEANRIGLPLEQAEALAFIIEGVNSHRATLWQTYQIAFFGLEKIKPNGARPAPREKTEAELEREVLNGERVACRRYAKQYRKDAKIKRAEATIALASGNEDLAGELKREAEDLTERAKGHTKKATEITKELTEAKEGDKKAKLVSKLTEVRNEIRDAKVLDGDINAMTITEILEYLV